MGHFTADLFDFLMDLEVNNDRAWMAANRARYETSVRDPLYAFCDDLAEPLHARVSPHLVAIGRVQRGSVMQINRDVRFSDDKTPYRTSTAASFSHEMGGRDVAAPGLYLHLEPGNAFMGGGMYHPPTKALTPVRQRIVDEGEEWDAVRAGLEAAGFTLGGESLKTSPRGFDADDPRIEDLRRTSFVCMKPIPEDVVLAEDFLDTYLTWAEQTVPFMRFLCTAHGLPF